MYGGHALQAGSPAHEAQWRQFLNNQHVHGFGTGSLVLAKMVAADLQANHRGDVLLVHIVAAKANGNIVLACYWQLLKSLSWDAIRDCTVRFPVKKQCLNAIFYYAISKTKARGPRRTSSPVCVRGMASAADAPCRVSVQSPCVILVLCHL